MPTVHKPHNTHRTTPFCTVLCKCVARMKFYIQIFVVCVVIVLFFLAHCYPMTDRQREREKKKHNNTTKTETKTIFRVFLTPSIDFIIHQLWLFWQIAFILILFRAYFEWTKFTSVCVPMNILSIFFFRHWNRILFYYIIFFLESILLTKKN